MYCGYFGSVTPPLTPFVDAQGTQAAVVVFDTHFPYQTFNGIRTIKLPTPVFVSPTDDLVVVPAAASFAMTYWTR